MLAISRKNPTQPRMRPITLRFTEMNSTAVLQASNLGDIFQTDSQDIKSQNPVLEQK